MTNLVFFSQPAAHAEILLTKDISADNGTDYVIDDPLFEIQYDFTPTSGNLRELNVHVSDDLEPVIALSQADINNRQDGQGDFIRVFPPFTVLLLQAPENYGQFVLDRWFINNQPQTAYMGAVAVVLSGNTQVEVRYHLAAGSLRLTPIAAPAGQIGFSFPSEPGVTCTLEQTSRLTNPTWATVETRTGDGGTQQFTRPIGANTAFFRVRAQQLPSCNASPGHSGRADTGRMSW